MIRTVKKPNPLTMQVVACIIAITSPMHQTEAGVGRNRPAMTECDRELPGVHNKSAKSKERRTVV